MPMNDDLIAQQMNQQTLAEHGTVQRPLNSFQGMNLGGEEPLPAPGSLTETMQNPRQSRRQAINEFTSNLMYTLSKSFAASASAPGQRGRLAAFSAALAAPGERQTMIAEQEAQSEKLKADREAAKLENEKKNLEMDELKKKLKEQYSLTVINGKVFKLDNVNHTVEDVTPEGAAPVPEPGKDVPYSPEVAAQMVRMEQAKRAPQTDSKIGDTVDTGDGIKQWNPETNRYDIPVGASKSTGGGAQRNIDPLSDLGIEQAKKLAVAKESETKKTAAEQTDDFARQYASDNALRGIASVDNLLPQVNNWTTGWGNYFFGNMPKSEAQALQAQLKTLQGLIAFGELTRMKLASKTGGALGQVSVIELQLLESVLGSLDPRQGAEVFRGQLNQIRAGLEKIKASVDAYYAGGGGGSPKPAPTGGGAGGGGATPKKGDIKTFPNGKRGKWDGEGWEPL